MKRKYGAQRISDAGSMPTFAETGSCLFQKRIFDVSFSLLVLVLLWPVMFAIALVIKLEGEGPGIFFVQDRVQMNGHVFRKLAGGFNGDPTLRNNIF